MNYLIELNEISKVFGQDDAEVRALNGINLKISIGEMIAVIGSSGSGKSTLLNIMGLLDTPTDGQYILLDKDVSLYSNKEKARLRNSTFGFVVQDFALVDKYTVKQNVEIPFTYSGKKYTRNEKDSIINTTLTQLGIIEKKETLVCRLSGGQRQRVAIARALVCSPMIILADEPTGALDSDTSKEIMNIFSDLNKKGKTVIIITHDSNIANYCSKIIELSDGKIKEEYYNGENYS